MSESSEQWRVEFDAEAQPQAGPGQRIVDLSHVIRDGMVTFPGLPGPEIGEYLSREQSRERYAPGTEFSFSRISMLANTGTYVDSPFHRFAGGDDIAAVQLSRLADLDALVEQRPALVGIDSLNIDDAADGTRPAHTALLEAGIPIVEHLRGLEQLPPYGFRFSAVPPAVQGMGSFPVRAYALVGDQR
ncbi:cyclase family protein [Catenulispora sp. NF23]|uniref:cyclase family protein n=1 Tax=Catenulispora pinistramenti TaxID=2705254 RepID=UPI001BA815C6|nr:cyclase family protein [Catenulispora pinistramenti]MBS2533686.1 cyclase family protein [Catenulispora pinistramenti]